MKAVGQPNHHLTPLYLFPVVVAILTLHLLHLSVSPKPSVNKYNSISSEGGIVFNWYFPRDRRSAGIPNLLSDHNQATDSPSPTPSLTSTATTTDTITTSPTSSPTNSITPTPSTTNTITPTPTSTPTNTPTPTNTSIASPSPTFVPLPTIVILAPPTQTPPQVNLISQPTPSTTPTVVGNLPERMIQSGNLPRIGLIAFTIALWTFITVGMYLYFTDRFA